MERTIALKTGKVKLLLVVVIWTAWICFYEALNNLLSNCTNTIMEARFRESVKFMIMYLL